jgi:hypothetical protein
MNSKKPFIAYPLLWPVEIAPPNPGLHPARSAAACGLASRTLAAVRLGAGDAAQRAA